jgi:hypothetical protein
MLFRIYAVERRDIRMQHGFLPSEWVALRNSWLLMVPRHLAMDVGTLMAMRGLHSHSSNHLYGTRKPGAHMVILYIRRAEMDVLHPAGPVHKMKMLHIKENPKVIP